MRLIECWVADRNPDSRNTERLDEIDEAARNLQRLGKRHIPETSLKNLLKLVKTYQTKS